MLEQVDDRICQIWNFAKFFSTCYVLFWPGNCTNLLFYELELNVFIDKVFKLEWIVTLDQDNFSGKVSRPSQHGQPDSGFRRLHRDPRSQLALASSRFRYIFGYLVTYFRIMLYKPILSTFDITT